MRITSPAFTDLSRPRFRIVWPKWLPCLFRGHDVQELSMSDGGGRVKTVWVKAYSGPCEIKISETPCCSRCGRKAKP